MLKTLFHDPLRLGLAQAAAAAMAALIVVFLARRRGIHLEKELGIALVRGLIQIVAVGSVLLLLLRAPNWTSIFLLTAMIVAAGATSAGRAKGMPGAFAVSTWAIACGAGSIIALMTLLGVIDTPITTLVPVGSMLIANAMNTNGLALNRLRSDVIAHVGEIETALALGADGKSAVASLCAGLVRSQPYPGDRFTAFTGDRMDSGSDGWDVALGSATFIRGDLSVCSTRYDFCVVWSHIAGEYVVDPGACVLLSRPAHASPGCTRLENATPAWLLENGV